MIVYKVVRIDFGERADDPKLFSVVAKGSYCIHYLPEVLTVGYEGTPLLAFDSLINAQRFIRIESFINVLIFECEAIRSHYRPRQLTLAAIEKGGDDHVKKFWTTRRGRFLYSCMDVPLGTVFCESLILKKLVGIDVNRRVQEMYNVKDLSIYT